jgi:hypothetical protein
MRALQACLRTLASLRRLPGSERRAYLEAWWALLECRLRLRFPGPLRGHHLLERALAPGDGVQDAAASQGDPHSCGELARLFRRAHTDQLCAAACLPRSLALLRFLSRHGVAARLELGLRRQAGGLHGHRGLQGHAWVVHGGRPVNDSASFVGGFRPLQRAGPGC